MGKKICTDTHRGDDVAVGSLECKVCVSQMAARGELCLIAPRKGDTYNVVVLTGYPEPDDKVMVGSFVPWLANAVANGLKAQGFKLETSFEPDTSSVEEDLKAGTQGTVKMVEAGLSRIEEAKENIRRFYSDSPMRPSDLVLIEPIIDTFGWIYPTDTVNACADVLRAANMIPLELQIRLKENWRNLKFGGDEGRPSK